MAKKEIGRPQTAHIAPFGLRLQPELKERIEAASKTAGRSMNAEIVDRLDRSFAAAKFEMNQSVPALLVELEERDETESRLRDNIRGCEIVLSLLHKRLAEAKVTLTDKESEKLNAVLAKIDAELARPEPIEAMLAKARALTEYAETLRQRLIGLGEPASPELNTTTLTEAEARWASAKDELAVRRRALKP
jgi:hypothetical protein